MTESDVWKYLRQGLANRCLFTRIESSAGNGVPDVILHFPSKHVFVENKYIAAWPKRATTLVKLPLRAEQRLWLSTRGKLSGDCWVFIRIEDDFFLLPWDVACYLYDRGFTKEQWLKFPYHWYNRIDFNQLYNILT